MVTVLLCGFAAGRFAIGLAPVVAAPAVSALLGFPAEHDNPSARLMARLFGVRDVGLGVVALAAAAGRVPVEAAIVFNGLHDVGDALAALVPLVRRQGVDRGAGATLALATTGALAWVALFLVAR